MKPLPLITNIILFVLMILIAIYGVKADDTNLARAYAQQYAENKQIDENLKKEAPPNYSRSSVEYGGSNQQIPSHASQADSRAVALRDKKIQLLEKKITILEKRIRELEAELEH